MVLRILLFVTNNNHTNTILITAAHHYDQPAFSCVNKEVKIFNTKLMKYMKLDNHISILEVDSNTEYFTSHGLHLKGLDKEAICNQIV